MLKNIEMILILECLLLIYIECHYLSCLAIYHYIYISLLHLYISTDKEGWESEKHNVV